MKKEVALVSLLSLPFSLAKNSMEKDLPIDDVLKMAEAEGLFDEYKGPFCSDIEASCVFNDTITVNCFEESKQPDGTYLITYVYKYIEEYKISLCVRVLTSALKKNLKYREFDNGTKLKIKGDLNMFVSGPMLFSGLKDSEENKSSLMSVVVTIIDIL